MTCSPWSDANARLAAGLCAACGGRVGPMDGLFLFLADAFTITLGAVVFLGTVGWIAWFLWALLRDAWRRL